MSPLEAEKQDIEGKRNHQLDVGIPYHIGVGFRLGLCNVRSNIRGTPETGIQDVETASGMSIQDLLLSCCFDNPGRTV